MRSSSVWRVVYLCAADNFPACTMDDLPSFSQRRVSAHHVRAAWSLKKGACARKRPCAPRSPAVGVLAPTSVAAFPAARVATRVALPRAPGAEPPWSSRLPTPAPALRRDVRDTGSLTRPLHTCQALHRVSSRRRATLYQTSHAGAQIQRGAVLRYLRCRLAPASSVPPEWRDTTYCVPRQ